MMDYLDKMTDAEYKIILVGDSTVGKTSLFKKITSGIFMERNVLTVGRDRKSFDVEITVEEEGKEVKKRINIFLEDTAGQERYRAITKTYFKGSSGVLLLYSICDKRSFINVKAWLDMAKENIGTYEDNKYLVFLMGTKVDIVENDESKREVTYDEALDFCDKNGVIFKGECSSKNFTDENFKQIFVECAKELYVNVGYNKIERETISTLQKKKTKKEKKHCHC